MVEPSADGAGLVVVANPGSASGTGEQVAEAVREALPGAEIRLLEPDDDVDVDEVLAGAAADGSVLGVVGGDGTVQSAARAALEAGIPLAVFPGGTLNHFARDLGLHTVADAVEAVRDGRVVAVDVGMIGDRPFVNNASIGAYAALVDERERLESRLGKWPAMVVAMVRILRAGERFDVVIDGEPHCVWMAFFGNCCYEPAGFAPTDRFDLVDGLLDVRLADASAPFSRTRLVLAVAFGALARSKVHTRRMVARVAVEVPGAGSCRLAADGETFDGPHSFVVGKRPAALAVHAPHDVG